MEFLATLVERQDAWQKAQFLLAAGKSVAPPSPIRISRPNDEPEPERVIVSDPRTIAAWFAKNVGGR